MKVLILKGLPASGKSTFAKNKCENDTSWVRVNRDDLRSMRGKYWSPGDERMITEWEVACITLAINNNKNVIIDATNFNSRFSDILKSRIIDAFYKKKVRDIFRCIKKLKFLDIYSIFFEYIEFEEKFFDVSLEVCIERDRLRGENGTGRTVGEHVIRGFYKKYLQTVGEK